MSEERNRLSRPGTEVSGSLSLDRATFKSLFYLLSGRPDSKARTFSRRILVTPPDLYDLNRRVQEKLRLHNITQCVAKVTLKLGNETSIDFGIWKEFEDFDWHRSTSTRDVTLRWDFLLELEGFEFPQRHTLTVKLSAAPGPQFLFRMMIIHGDEDEDSPFQLGACVARVDFISHRLADELLDVVEEWNKCVPECDSLSPNFAVLHRYDNSIARIIHYSSPVLFGVAAWAYFHNITAEWSESSVSASNAIKEGVEWLFLAGFVVYAGNILGGILANQSFKSLNEYGKATPFNLTTGDSQARSRFSKYNKRSVSRFISAVAVSVVVNILSAGVTASCLGWLTSD